MSLPTFSFRTVYSTTQFLHRESPCLKLSSIRLKQKRFRFVPLMTALSETTKLKCGLKSQPVTQRESHLWWQSNRISTLTIRSLSSILALTQSKISSFSWGSKSSPSCLRLWTLKTTTRSMWKLSARVTWIWLGTLPVADMLCTFGLPGMKKNSLPKQFNSSNSNLSHFY